MVSTHQEKGGARKREGFVTGSVGGKINALRKAWRSFNVGGDEVGK